MTKCFACGLRTEKKLGVVQTEHGALVLVDPDCYRFVKSAGPLGFEPIAGGPRLFLSGEKVSSRH